MGKSHMDLTQAELFLTSQAKKREGGLTEDQAKVFLKFWRTHRAKIHEHLVKKSLWNTSLKNLSWRVDIQHQSRHQDHTSIPTAIVELHLRDGDGDHTNGGEQVLIVSTYIFVKMPTYYYMIS